MTWKALFARLKDPMIVFALMLAVAGQLQQQGDMLLSLVGPKWAGFILSMIGGGVAMLRILQTLPAKPEDTHDDGTAGESQ